MAYRSNENLYLDLIGQFLRAQIDAEAFCNGFSRLWKADRDEESAVLGTWPERYDLKLIEEYDRGQISAEEFERRWSELFGYSDHKYLLDMLNRPFTACDVYSPEPDREFEIDETQLRNEVAAHLASFEEARAKKRS